MKFSIGGVSNSMLSEVMLWLPQEERDAILGEVNELIVKRLSERGHGKHIESLDIKEFPLVKFEE